MKKMKLLMPDLWIVRRSGRVFKVCSERDPKDCVRLEFRTKEEAEEFADEANRMQFADF